jgi:uncharacterized protein YggE
MALWFASLSGMAAAQPATPRSLTLTASGEVSAAPDLARLEMVVQAEAATASAALSDAAQRLTAIFDTLDEAGIAGRDRQTREIRLDPVYERDERGNRVGLTGYRAMQAFLLTLRDLDRLGVVLDTLAGAGLDAFGGFAFDVADRAALLDEARRRAVQEARRIAALTAEAAGETLGAPISIDLLDERHNGPRPMRAAVADEALMPVASGEITVSASVRVTYSLD